MTEEDDDMIDPSKLPIYKKAMEIHDVMSSLEEAAPKV
jgi:hypothetical protein